MELGTDKASEAWHGWRRVAVGGAEARLGGEGEDPGCSLERPPVTHTRGPR